MPLSQIVSASIENGAVAPVDLSSVAQYTGFKNRIINGAFGIWQRGTTTSTNTFLADRWANYAATSITASRSTDVPAGFQYSVSISGTNVPQTYQRIESVNCIDLPGQSITVSFWAKQTSGAGASSLAVSLASPNAADNYASTTPIGTTTFTGSTSWTQYTATYTNVNSAIANGIQIIIYANTSGAATFLVTGVQIEKGVTATSFDYRPYGTELALCQRYYYRISPAAAASELAVGYSYSTVGMTAVIPNPVVMRAAPSALEQSGTASDYRIYRGGAATNTTCSSVPLFSAATTNYINVTFTVASGLSNGSAGSIATATTAGYLGWSAEL